MREIILGPPGTGKTATLLQAADDELARGTPPDRVALVTFTRRAAEEAVGRACAKFNLTPDDLPLFRTLHSLAFRALGLNPGEVFQGARVREFAEWSGAELSPRAWLGRAEREGAPAGHGPDDRALHMAHLARVRCVALEHQFAEDDDGLEWREVDYFARSLESFKSRHGLLDFTDMLERFLDCEPPAIDALLVDEGQDLSPLQWRMVERLAVRAHRIVISGDDDQAIHCWAGADIEHFVKMLGRVRVLEQSWRVPAAIQQMATELIEPVDVRRPKHWRPRADEGEVDEGELDDEALWKGEWRENVQPVLVLARNAYVLEQYVVPALRRLGVLYEWSAQPAVASALLAAVHAWERLRAGGEVSAEAARGVYRLLGTGGVARGHRELPGVPDNRPLTIADLRAEHGLLTAEPWYAALRIGEEDESYLRAARRRGERLNARPRVRLSTIHSAKGGEARRVVLMTEMAARTWREMERHEDDERRVWYVAATRARETLTIVRGARGECCPWL